jgi:glycogen synthase
MFDPDVVRGTRVQELAELWDIPDDAFVMLLPGRLTGWKGQGVLLSALQQISQEADLPQNWVCVFVGEAGRKKDYAKELVEQSRLSGIC